MDEVLGDLANGKFSRTQVTNSKDADTKVEAL